MRALLSGFFTLVLLVPILAVGVIFVVLQDAPLVVRDAALTAEQISRVKQLFAQHDPRKPAPTSLRTVRLSAQDADLVVHHLFARFVGAKANVELRPGELHVLASKPLPENPIGRVINVEATFVKHEDQLVIQSLRIGQLSVPEGVGRLALRLTLAFLQRSADIGALFDAIDDFDIEPGGVRVTYRWDQDMVEQVRSVAVPVSERERLKVYQAHLSEVLNPHQGGADVPLLAVLRPLFAMAAARDGNPDLVAEHRAALSVLAVYVGGRSLTAIVPEARAWPVPRRVTLTLAGRADLAQHFVISAALVAQGSGVIADAVGMYKEVRDAQVGSGFSFQDIAADRAGTLFGEMATGSTASARRLQALMGEGLSEQDLLPAISDLPEFMREAEFVRRFGGVGTPAFQTMIDEIESRLKALSLHQ